MESCKWRTTFGIAICSAIALLILKTGLLVLQSCLLYQVYFLRYTEEFFGIGSLLVQVREVILTLKTAFVFLIFLGLCLDKIKLLRLFLWPASICFMAECLVQLFSIIFSLYQTYDDYLIMGIAIGIDLVLLLLDGVLSLLINNYYHNITSGKVNQSSSPGNEKRPTGFVILV